MGDSEYRQGDLVVQIHAPACGRDLAVRALDETPLRQARELVLEAFWFGHALRGAKTEHQRFRDELPPAQFFTAVPLRAGSDVVAGSLRVPATPRGSRLGDVRVRARARAVDRAAAPVSKVVPRLVARPRKVRHFVTVVASGFELRACGVQLVPLEVRLDFGNLALGAATEEQRALLEGQAVGRDVLRPERDTLTQRVDPRLERLVRDRVDEVDADVAQDRK